MKLFEGLGMLLTEHTDLSCQLLFSFDDPSSNFERIMSDLPRVASSSALADRTSTGDQRWRSPHTSRDDNRNTYEFTGDMAIGCGEQ